MKRIINYIFILAVLFVVLVSCEYKKLVYDYYLAYYWFYIDPIYDRDWQYASDETAISWMDKWDSAYFGFGYDSLRPEVPKGLYVVASDLLGDNPNVVSNIDSDGGYAYLANKENSLLLYNRDTKYLVLDDLDSLKTATATARSRMRSTYEGNPYSSESEELTVAPPDVLYASFVDMAKVDRRKFDYEIDTLAVRFMPLVYTYHVRYNVVEGEEYLGIARGALSGMAGSVYLCGGKTIEQPVTVLYDCCLLEGFGVVANVNSFGVSNADNADQRYALNLEMRLNNGEFMNFNFDVTEQVKNQPRGGVIEVGNIEIPDSIGQKDGTLGFDVEVDGWGDYIDIDIPL